MMRHIASGILAALGLSVLVLHAQAPERRPQFEVASIRPSPANSQFDPHCDGDGGSPGRLILNCVTVKELIRFAYGVYANGLTRRLQPLQISGGPAWLDSARFDIEAKAEGNASSEMMAGPMLQRLLEDRFKLKFHRETRERPVYALIVDKGGLRIQPLKEVCQPPDPCRVAKMRSNGQNMTLDAHAMSMADFSGTLGLDRPVIDRTGVAGTFNFHLEFVLDATTPGNPFGSHDPLPSGDGAGASIFTAIQRLGLKLESTKGPVEFLVVDRAEKPSEN